MNHLSEPCLAKPLPRKQGQYLAFIHAYTLVNGRPPGRADIQKKAGGGMIVSRGHRALVFQFAEEAIDMHP